MEKIMILANDTTYTYNLRDEVIERLIKEKYEVVIAAKMLHYQDELQSLGVRLIDIQTNRHGKNPLSDILLLQKYYKLIKTEKPDIVLTYNIKPNSYGGIACRLTKTRYLTNITGLGTAIENPSILQIIAKKIYKAGVAGACCVFFQNEENRQFFINHSMLRKKCKTVLLPGSGVNLKKHLPLEYPKGEVINFLFVARVMKEKGIDIYLNAAKQIHQKYNNTLFHICGICDDEKYLKKLKETDKYIQYHGEQKNMIPFYEMAHCIVHPSFYPEGMSNVLLEAAAHCRPIITTDRSGCREIVDNGINGYIIPCHSHEKLIESIEMFMKLCWLEKKAMGIAARQKVEKEFDRQIVAEKYLEEVKKA
ncbi:galacturonosyltransferase [Aristaeella hokkaidonensis]|uniref:Glycosyltransferase family 4 protein n=2 Tax=Aristaeella hokkaidonensis TaxID=3046382 RepID=A0AC61MZC9_9FIRM|nr:glycosyltransferase family 4 protein [Aristaeella hokkaidonensis]QUC68612.1 glycosyltransferase family 4 protein [Aristaeella hokkaidonensis]SNT95222.1 galacturonosyltransferase [Aristaeella hokkaidonensis]